MPDIGKIHRILEVLQEHSDTGISNKEVSAELKMPVSTCSRILAALRKYDFVYKRPSDSRYFLGYAHLRFAQSLLATSDEVFLCRPILDELYKKIEETVFYAKFTGNYCVVIDVRGPVNPRIAVGLGELMPLHCSAAGKAVLAFIPKYEREKLYKKIPFDRYTNQTRIDVIAIEAEIADIQATHVAFNHAEYHEGINALAVPVFNRYGGVAGSVTTVGTAARLSDKIMKEKSHVLLTAAKQISEQIIRGEIPMRERA